MSSRIYWLTLFASLALGCGDKAATEKPASVPDSLRDAAPAPVPQTTSVLPTPQDSTVSWPEFTALVRATPDSIRAVMQHRSLEVTATFRDGHRFHTKEPSFGAVMKLMREVDPAGHVLLATE